MMLMLLDAALLTATAELPERLDQLEQAMRQNGKSEELPSDENIADVIDRARAGDSDAFSVLVETYEKYVYHVACRVLSSCGGSVSLADDAAQNAFLKAWRSLDSFRGDCAFSTWLFRITVNAARDILRSEARRPAVSLTQIQSADEDEPAEWDVPVTSGDTVPESALEQRETVLAVRRAIEQLPEEQRQVVVLRDLNGLPYRDIAELLGVELGTVKSRLNRGRASLATLLREQNLL